VVVNVALEQVFLPAGLLLFSPANYHSTNVSSIIFHPALVN
jgi:hypothetical protein